MERRTGKAVAASSPFSNSDSLTIDLQTSESFASDEDVTSKLLLQVDEEEDRRRYIVSPNDVLLLRRDGDEDNDKGIKRDYPDYDESRTSETPNSVSPVVIDRSKIKSSEDYSEANKEICAAPPELPDLIPLEEGDVITAEQCTLLTALEEENVPIKISEAICKTCYSNVKVLKSQGTLKRYNVNEEEAATLCAISMLIEAGLDIGGLAEHCTEKKPSKLMLKLLLALRKLPQCRGVLYFERRIKRKKKGKENFIQHPFCFVSKDLYKIVGSESKTGGKKEVLRVEDGWGYDISDFYPSGKREERKERHCNYHQYNASMLNTYFFFKAEPRVEGEVVLMEPWSVFKVLDSGIRKRGMGATVVPLKMVDSRLAYEKEIYPGFLRHVIKALKDKDCTTEKARVMLKALSDCPFDTRCTCH